MHGALRGAFLAARNAAAGAAGSTGSGEAAGATGETAGPADARGGANTEDAEDGQRPASASPRGPAAAASRLPPPTLADFRGTGRGAWLTGAQLRALVLRYQTHNAPTADGVGPEAEELLGRALETSTWGSRATHMAALCSFLQARRRALPLTEHGLVAFIGFLYTCIVTKAGPQLRGASLAGYLSGVRSVHSALGLGALPMESESLLLAAAAAGYRKAADATIPPTTVRIGIPVHVLYKIMQLSQGPRADRRCKRDAALLITAVVFGLRPAGVEGIRPAHVTELSSERCELLVAHLKGLTVEQAMRRGGRTFYAPDPVPGRPITVLSVLAAWRDIRSAAAARWFDSPGLPAASLDAATKSLTSAVGYAPPTRCGVSGHSARITAFSQAVLMGWSELRLQVRFDWRKIEDMGGVYLDHRVRTSAASRLFFDPALPEPDRSARAQPEQSASPRPATATRAAPSAAAAASSASGDGPTLRPAAAARRDSPPRGARPTTPPVQSPTRRSAGAAGPRPAPSVADGLAGGVSTAPAATVAATTAVPEVDAAFDDGAFPSSQSRAAGIPRAAADAGAASAEAVVPPTSGVDSVTRTGTSGGATTGPDRAAAAAADAAATKGPPDTAVAACRTPRRRRRSAGSPGDTGADAPPGASKSSRRGRGAR